MRIGNSAIIFAFACLVCRAQGSDVPELREPILSRAPEFSQWTIRIERDRQRATERIQADKSDQDVEDNGEEPRAVLLPREVIVLKQGEIYRETTRWSNGRTTEKWIVGRFQLRESERTGGIHRVMGTGAYYHEDYSDYSRSDFENLEWIGMDNYQGVRSVGGRVVHVFEVSHEEKRLTPRERSDRVVLNETQAERTLGEETNADGRRLIAFLDVETQLPVFFDDGEVARIYRFSDAPTGRLRIPDEFATAFAKWNEEVNASNLAPPSHSERRNRNP